MHVTMVKKRLANGEPCRKCAQAEELLKNRGLWSRIDEVVWADENDPNSPGSKLGARHGVAVAPFFIVRDEDGTETVYESALKFIKDRLSEAPPTIQSRATGDVNIEALQVELEGRHPSEILKWGLEHYGALCGIAFSGAEDVVLVHMASAMNSPSPCSRSTRAGCMPRPIGSSSEYESTTASRLPSCLPTPRLSRPS